MAYIELFEILNVPESEWAPLSNTSTPIYVSANSSDLLEFSIPEGKLFYPEPFIASPSYLHSDLPYLHIFQYWYWLWFMFIFLICFFFISFISAVRWCSMRTRPRRETRGVSRSKCGDLITACVPVSWAMSIIVNESTDATDLNDGFGTSELVVGVRAYQWGWEYYYPKSVDLNYNIRNGYASFIGNSIHYTPTSTFNSSTNFLWKMYQNETDDRIVTPAHLLLIPANMTATSTFLNFKDIGLNTLKESAAFSKIRNFTKAYSTHLVHSPSHFTTKYQKLNSLYTDESSFLNTSSLGHTKQHTLTSVSTLGNDFTSNSLDLKSFSQFLDSNAGLSTTLVGPTTEVSQLPLNVSKFDRVKVPTTFLLADSVLGLKHASQSHFLNFPAFVESFNDNSDKDKLTHPTLAPITTSLVVGGRKNLLALSTGADLAYIPSVTTPNPNSTLLNNSYNPRNLNINGPNSKVLLNDQSIRNLPTTKLTHSHLNFSLGFNSVASNFNLAERLNEAGSPYSNTTSLLTGGLDKSVAYAALTTQTHTSTPHSAVISSNSTHSNLLSYDSGVSQSTLNAYNKDGILTQGYNLSRKSPVGDVFIGSREKTPRSINTSYWDTYWTGTTNHQRLLNVLGANLRRSTFALPLFSTYADYDFRNDQALDMLEELFWEQGFSTYVFYDYVTLSKGQNKLETLVPKRVSLTNTSYRDSMGRDALATYPSTKSLVTTYATSTQTEDYSPNPGKVTLSNFSYLPLFSDLLETEETFNQWKHLSYLSSLSSNPLFSVNSVNFGSRSALSVFNTFRSDFNDFAWLPYNSNSSHITPMELNTGSGASLGQEIRVSNPVTIRSSVRNSIVNSNAFQKVFKARLDENRAHVQADSYSDLATRQPFLSDVKIPYLQLLGKNRNYFFTTPLFTSTSIDLWNSLTPLYLALNSPTFSFPFLVSRTSDTSRFTWIDWFSKWKYVEVQPSSVSKYSTLGVPYLRKPFDFNSSVGDKFQDTELYFTRLARSRRNYLSNWSYSPYSFNRSYTWFGDSKLNSLFSTDSESLSKLKATLIEMRWYWLNPVFNSDSDTNFTFSSSGNDVYHKSTWRPRVSIQSYYYNLGKLVDILSRREYLYRSYFNQTYGIYHLPSFLRATPTNPLFVELKSSFRFFDPASFGSEISRDLIYTSNNFLKSLSLQYTFNALATLTDTLPINTTLLTKYLCFYFLDAKTETYGNNAELYKSQFRPLRKGISSMLRLHATGAVAMPIEIRLQVLASSRDVIHSWAIPSAHVKIDCVPGYTSHRIMKFLLTGVYWGQCQEICGRYHHWMPIVIYFMKPDLFVLWCVHFVFTPSQGEHYNSANNWFQTPLVTTSRS